MKNLWRLILPLVIVCFAYQQEVLAQEQVMQAKSLAPVTYKIIVSQEQFEEAKKADINFKSSDFIIGDLQVTSQLTSIEITERLKSDAKKKAAIAKIDVAKVEMPKVKAPEIKIYKLVVDEATFNQVKKDKKPFSFSKMMMGDDVQYVETSAEEKKAFSAVEFLRKKIKVGDTFPAFKLATADGKNMTESVFQGKLTLLNFYFDKCEPCIKETSELNRFAQNYPAVQTIAITFDSTKQAQEYVAQHQFAWPILVEGDKLIRTDIGLSSYPSFALVDGQGKVLGLGSSIEIGINDHKAEAALVAWIAKLTDGKSVVQKAAP
nr:TlpA disulfide reductase family protein [uncultured Undibacterium sp.]